MPREIVDVPLANGTPGIQTSIRMIRYGSSGARPKAYIQAALHADEAPGTLVAHHLLKQLDAADARGEITGQVVVVPAANPLGLAQFVNGDHLGRYDIASGRNFNRGWPALADDLLPLVGDRLTGDADTNVEMIRTAIADIVAQCAQTTPFEALQTALASEAYDSDIVLDLHCDDEGLMHLFVHPRIWPDIADLSGELGCRAVFAQAHSGGYTFTEAGTEPWLKLADAFPELPIPIGCHAVTVELRGFSDVGDDIARTDAAALINVLRRRGYLAGQATQVPEPLCAMTGFDACDVVRTPQFGVVVYHAALGEYVARGQPIADIVTPSAQDYAERVTVCSATDGVVITRRVKKMVGANQVIAKIAGEAPLSYRKGYLLED